MWVKVSAISTANIQTFQIITKPTTVPRASPRGDRSLPFLKHLLEVIDSPVPKAFALGHHPRHSPNLRLFRHGALPATFAEKTPHAYSQSHSAYFVGTAH